MRRVREGDIIGARSKGATDMDMARYETWVTRSFRWIRDPARDGGLPHHIQLLGLADAKLRGIRRKDLVDAQGEWATDDNDIPLRDHVMIQAHLWVLGVYEFIRMLDERLRHDPSLATDASVATITATKRVFSRLRVPLAKLEPEQRHAKHDYPVPLPGLGPQGIGWQLNDSLIVYQEELSDAFMTMLEALRPRPDSV